MIFEVPTQMFPASTDTPTAAKELKKTSNTNGLQLYLNKEMNSMNKALGGSDNGVKSAGLFNSFKKFSTGSSNIFEKAASSGSGIASSLAEKMSNASGAFHMKL